MGSATTRAPRGFKCSTTLLIVPPLPAASRPSKISRTFCPLAMTCFCHFNSSICSFCSSSSYFRVKLLTQTAWRFFFFFLSLSPPPPPLSCSNGFPFRSCEKSHQGSAVFLSLLLHHPQFLVPRDHDRRVQGEIELAAPAFVGDRIENQLHRFPPGQMLVVRSDHPPGGILP